MLNKVITLPIEETETLSWANALKLGDRQNRTSAAEEKAVCQTAIAKIREQMGAQARVSRAPATVEFGTSGWRGRIGEDFTIHNVKKVTRAIIDTMQTAAFLAVNNYSCFAEVQERGLVVFRDNRYLGEEFMAAAIAELHAAGIRTYAAGECPTGIGSAVVTELGAAGSLNFTPSHNPMDYAGLKFNPADGGPAGLEITSLVQGRANEYMQTADFQPAAEIDVTLNEEIFPVYIYLDFLQKSQIIDLAKLKELLLANKDKITLIIDNMHGASRGVFEAIFGEDIISQLDIRFRNTETDYSFHGVKPEPSAANQEPLIAELQRSDKPLTLAAALDPDADRIRFADRNLDIDMNMFSAIALDYAIKRGLLQGVATSVASSGFAAAIARQENLPVESTAVGFKNFRAPLAQQRAAVAFEESDGISFIGHTLEKDGIIGFLVALSAVLESGKNLSALYSELQEKYGYYYPGKSGRTIENISITEWQRLRQAVIENIKTGYKIGSVVMINGEAKKISQILSADGLKFIFEDDSWILLRSSGTETKFRYYYETTGQDNDKILPAYEQAAEQILEQALREVV
ncbi:MAG: phosphomannomutase [Candidatus Margulisbacteria bacterium]|jgi:phosphomannomutase|nr:phosphomannomutase [Candidatus Margulisiibacteriota bacterium]